MTKIAADLLAGIAGELWSEAIEVVPKVPAGQGEALPRPLRHVAEAQRTLYERAPGLLTDPATFQLPEPMRHPVDRPAVLVRGWHPGYSPQELLPTLSASVTEYIGFYRDIYVPLGRTTTQRDPVDTASSRCADGSRDTECPVWYAARNLSS